MKAKRKILKTFVVTIVTLLGTIVACSMFFELKTKIRQHREYAYRNEIRYDDGMFFENDERVLNSNYEVNEKWFEKYSFIAHSGGVLTEEYIRIV